MGNFFRKAPRKAASNPDLSKEPAGHTRDNTALRSLRLPRSTKPEPSKDEHGSDAALRASTTPTKQAPARTPLPKSTTEDIKPKPEPAAKSLEEQAIDDVNKAVENRPQSVNTPQAVTESKQHVLQAEKEQAKLQKPKEDDSEANKPKTEKLSDPLASTEGSKKTAESLVTTFKTIDEHTKKSPTEEKPAPAPVASPNVLSTILSINTSQAKTSVDDKKSEKATEETKVEVGSVFQDIEKKLSQTETSDSVGGSKAVSSTLTGAYKELDTQEKEKPHSDSKVGEDKHDAGKPKSAAASSLLASIAHKAEEVEKDDEEEEEENKTGEASKFGEIFTKPQRPEEGKQREAHAMMSALIKHDNA